MLGLINGAFMNNSEPFGLPPGTIRGIITLAFTGATIFLFVTGQAVDQALLGITTLILGHYFGNRTASQGTAPTVLSPVAAPYIPGEDKDV